MGYGKGMEFKERETFVLSSEPRSEKHFSAVFFIQMSIEIASYSIFVNSKEK